MQKYVVIVGGVISGVGKGVATASIGKILQEYGYTTTAIKIDPYINYDAGTLRPTEHGEVWVTDDGGEIDQDLGSYERFLGRSIPKKNNITTGQIYKAVIDRERRGEYLGQTVQFIPHVTDEIKRRIKEAAEDYEIVLIEIGGTVGDYENIPYLFAIKGMELEIGKENVSYILITFLPVPYHIGEMKTKPTQQAIKHLQEVGISPDIILCRGPVPLDSVRRKKIEIYANIKSDYVISAPDTDNIYEIPLNFEKEHLGLKILEKLNLKPRKNPDFSEWRKRVENLEKPDDIVKIAMVGKYVKIGDYILKDSYISINEALKHASAETKIGVEIDWLDSNKITFDDLKGYHGIIVPGGFGSTGIEGKILAIQYAREKDVPFLGLCLGMQLAVCEYARNVCGLTGATSAEFSPDAKYKVIDFIPSQKRLIEKKKYGGTMRLGAYAAFLSENSLVYKLYKETGRLEKDMQINLPRKRKGKIPKDKKYFVVERHRHRYEVNPEFIPILEQNGLKFSGVHINLHGEELMEFLELPGHIFFVATQSHPEFKSRFLDPAPLFIGFLKACQKKKYS